MNPDEPGWVSRYRKFLVAVGGAMLEGAALWQDAHPAAIGTLAFITAALVATVRNDQP